MGGWLEKGKVKLNSTQVAVEVEARVKLGNFVGAWQYSSRHSFPSRKRACCIISTTQLVPPLSGNPSFLVKKLFQEIKTIRCSYSTVH